MLSLSDNQYLLVKNAAKELGFKQWDIQPTDISVTGGGYTSKLKFITLIDKEGNLDNYDLLFKVCEEDEAMGKQFPMLSVYFREQYMYSNLFPYLATFQQEYNIKEPFSSVPRFFGAVPQDKTVSFLFENLASQNYQASERKCTMDARNIELVFKEYAKFHACAFAMKELQPEKYKDFVRNLGEIGEDILYKPLHKFGLKRACDLLDGYPGASTAIKDFEKADKFFSEDLKNPADQLVVVHGDSWGNNFMFQHKDDNDPGNPTSVRILDWQLSKMGSPAYDLAHHMCLCAPKSVLQNIDKYLKLYHDTLSKNLREFGCDPDKMFPFSMLIQHWKKYCMIGVLYCATYMPMLLGEIQDVETVNDVANDESNALDYFAGCLLNNKELGPVCTERILDCILSFHEQGYLNQLNY